MTKKYDNPISCETHYIQVLLMTFQMSLTQKLKEKVVFFNNLNSPFVLPRLFKEIRLFSFCPYSHWPEQNFIDC